MKDKIKILFICHGNICRSTMAESVLTHLVKTRHLDHLFEINSAATSREEIGNGPHYGTVNKLREKGIPVIPHRSVQMTKSDYEYYDYLIGMDTANIRNMNRIADGDPDGKIYKLLTFAGMECHAAARTDGKIVTQDNCATAAQHERQTMRRAAGNTDVADPWYTGDFDATYRDVLQGCEGFLGYLREHDAISATHLSSFSHAPDTAPHPSRSFRQ